MNKWIATASILLALAVCAGAFGAHALKGRLDQYSIAVYEKAVFYHFVHALGLLIVSSTQATSERSLKSANIICVLLTIGILIFSGSLYLLALSGIKWLGAVTPLGGLAFIVAWIVLAVVSL